MNLTDEERRDARSRPFPLQIAPYGEKSEPGPPSIPWSVADKAYCTYARRYGSQQSVERLSQRGGFSLSEMDDLYPPWRDEVSEITKLKSDIAFLESLVGWRKMRDEAKKVCTSGAQVADQVDSEGGETGTVGDALREAARLIDTIEIPEVS